MLELMSWFSDSYFHYWKEHPQRKSTKLHSKYYLMYAQGPFGYRIYSINHPGCLLEGGRLLFCQHVQQITKHTKYKDNKFIFFYKTKHSAKINTNNTKVQ